MTETSETAAGAETSAPSAATETSGTSGTSETAAAQTGEQPGPNGHDSASAEVSNDPAQRALDRAKARIAAASKESGKSTEQAAGDGDSTQTTSPSETPGEQAAGDGDSTQSGESKTETDTTDDTTSGDNSSNSTVDAPENWPQELRERFDQLPKEGEAREIVLDIQKQMQRGFTKATQDIAQERKELRGLVNMQHQFRQEPKKVIQDLAKEAGMDVWFEQPPPKGELPEFKDANEMAEYVQRQVEQQLEQKTSSKEEQERYQQAAEQAQQNLRSEIEAAKGNHKDWNEIQPDVVKKLRGNPALAVEDAIQLVRLPKMQSEIERLRKVEQAHAELKAKQEKQEKLIASSQPGAGGGDVNANVNDDDDAATRAFKRAKAKKAAEGARYN